MEGKREDKDLAAGRGQQRPSHLPFPEPAACPSFLGFVCLTWFCFILTGGKKSGWAAGIEDYFLVRLSSIRMVQNIAGVYDFLPLSGQPAVSTPLLRVPFLRTEPGSRPSLEPPIDNGAATDRTGGVVVISISKLHLTGSM